ncbi:lactate utilization protein C [Shewanella sp. 10N.286.51.B2]|uniref:LutC/YkgG family protein n=1 Tax=Shewanella sp. 10N.286.51.B2 TaxID=3229707 RepID=UPI003550D2E5
MSSKNTILAALQKSAVATATMPVIDIPLRDMDLVSAFNTNLSAVAGKLIQQGGIAALNSYTHELISQGKQVLSMVDGVSGNRQQPDTAHAMQDIDFTVLKGEIAVAENGAIWVSLPQSHRVTPFICENLIITIAADDIVQDMHQAIKLINSAVPSFGVFIAGPSKTADIEQALVVGAHGACSLDVYLV